MKPGSLFLILQGFLKEFAIFSHKPNELPVVKVKHLTAGVIFLNLLTKRLNEVMMVSVDTR